LLEFTGREGFPSNSYNGLVVALHALVIVILLVVRASQLHRIVVFKFNCLGNFTIVIFKRCLAEKTVLDSFDDKRVFLDDLAVILFRPAAKAIRRIVTTCHQEHRRGESHERLLKQFIHNRSPFSASKHIFFRRKPD
jgi:hypothetical protein